MANGVFERVAIVAVGFFFAGMAATGVQADDAKQVYETTCVPCHGMTGAGDGPAGAALDPRPANFSTALDGKSDVEIAKVIKEGGAAVGKSPLMAPFGAVLSDDQIKGIIAYIKTFKDTSTAAK